MMRSSKEMERKAGRKTERKAGREAGQKTEREAARNAEREAERKTERNVEQEAKRKVARNAEWKTGQTVRSKRTYFGRKIIITSVMACIISMGLSGCAKETDAEAGENISAEELEKSEEQKTTGEQEKQNGQEGQDKEGGENAQENENGEGRENAQEGENGEGGENAQKRENGKNGQGDESSQKGQNGQEGQGGQEGESQPQKASGETELYGDIMEIQNGQFTVSEITVTSDASSGTEMAVMAAPNEESLMNLIMVVYDENTVFMKRTIWDGGARHEDREASSADLEKDLTAEMKGSYEDDVFHAGEIRIVEVVL